MAGTEAGHDDLYFPSSAVCMPWASGELNDLPQARP
jgi:hypothetical protein